MIKKSSLAHDFTIFSTIVILTVLLFSIAAGLLVHHTYYSRQELKIIDKAELLDRELTTSLNFITHYSRFLGNKIIHNTDKNTNSISQIFAAEDYSKPTENDIWTRFGWIDSSKDIDKKILGDVSNHSYLNKDPIKGIMKFYSPEIGINSNKWIIPSDIDIKNKQGDFIGKVTSGINLTKLTDKLEHVFNRKDLVFMMFDENLNFILSSNDISFSYKNNILPPTSMIEHIKDSVLIKNETSSFLRTPISYNQFRFNYFKHSRQYPFFFLIGENVVVSNEEYWQIIFPRIAELTFMGILFIILLYYFRKHIIRPIILLSNAAKRIANGEMDVKIIGKQYDEVNLLANQLQEIQSTKAQLIKSKADIESINNNLELKVKERTIELEQALMVKTDFLNNISHEVRTPVQGITSISQGLVEEWNTHNDEKKYALASSVASDSQRLFSLISNLLDLSLFNSGEIYFNLQEADLVKLTKDIINECNKLYIKDKSIKIRLDSFPEKANLIIDINRILQILRHILTNSIKFMNQGTISISIENSIIINNEQENIPAYMVTIKDEGINVPENELTDIFTAFSQSSNTKNKISGAGLGLTICKKVIDGHHGKIWAKNNKEKGITISFTLPIIQKETQPIKTKKLTDSSKKSINILMIDDEPTCQMSMDILLSNTDFHLISAYGGIEGLEYLSKNYKTIDLVFLDLMMPDMYGLNVLIEIRSRSETQDIPVIIQSGTNDNKEIEKAMASGAQDYVRKPYKRQQILDIIKKFI